jgi:hypothetical protein
MLTHSCCLLISGIVRDFYLPLSILRAGGPYLYDHRGDIVISKQTMRHRHYPIVEIYCILH